MFYINWYRDTIFFDYFFIIISLNPMRTFAVALLHRLAFQHVGASGGVMVSKLD